MGVLLTKNHLYLNVAIVDLLKASPGSLLMVFVDKKNNAFAIRNARDGELSGSYTVATDKASRRALRIAASTRLMRTFPWCKPGTFWKAKLADNMIVVENTL